jgi:hypothetical protein
MMGEIFRRRWLWITIVILVVVASGTALAWHWHEAQLAKTTPFSRGIIASMQFPLYYPTQLPTGFHIDRGSVKVPQEGVVVFTMLGPNNAKLYMSEEARPSKYGIGNFYNNFANLKEVPVSDGAIAVGRLGHGTIEVASRADNKTWVITNTKASIPPDQLITMLKTWQLSY